MTAFSGRAARSTTVRLSLNSLWLFSARVIGQALTLLFTLAVARALGDVVFGQLAFITSVVFIGNVVTTFGLDTLLIRDVAASRASQATTPRGVTSAALLLQLALSAVFIAAIWTLAPRLPNQSAATIPAFRLASLSLIPLAFSTVFSAILRGHERMGAFTWFSIATTAALGFGGLVIWLRGGSLLGAAWVVLAAQTVGAVAAFLLCRVSLPPMHTAWGWPSRAVVSRVLRTGSVLAGLMILAVVYQRLGVLLLSMLVGDAATGLYSAAARVLEALKLIPGAFFGALFPMMAAGLRPEAGRVYKRSFAALLGLSFLLAALTALFAQPIIALLYGPDYGAAVVPLQIMCWSLPLTVLTFKLSFDLVLGGNERVATLWMLLTLLIAVVVTATLIARWSLNGAAVALVISEAIQVIILGALTAAGRRRASD